MRWQDRAHFYADMDFVDVPVDWLVSKDYAEQRRKLIDAQREIRLEALIVLLIAIEMSVYFYELFIRGG